MRRSGPRITVASDPCDTAALRPTLGHRLVSAIRTWRAAADKSRQMPSVDAGLHLPKNRPWPGHAQHIARQQRSDIVRDQIDITLG